jgi:hypothetical protein
MVESPVDIELFFMGYLFMLFVIFFDFRKLLKNLVRIILTNTVVALNIIISHLSVIEFKKCGI